MKQKMMYSVLGILLIASAIYLYTSLTPTSKNNSIYVGCATANMDCAPFYVAYAKGFFKNHNLTVKIVPMGSAGEVKLALSAGQINIGLAGAVNFFVPISKGVPIKIIGPLATGKTYLYVRPDSKIRTFNDLVGKTVAFTALGGMNEYEVRRILKKENVDANKIHFINMERVYRPIALMEKEIVDAVPIDQSEVPKYAQLGAVLHEEWGMKGYGSHKKPESVIAVNEDFKTAYPLLVERFIDALIDGHRFMKSNSEKAAEAVASYVLTESGGASIYSPENLNGMWENKELEYTLWYDPVTIVDLSQVGVDIGQLDSSLILEQIYDLSFEKKLKDAQNEIYGTN